MKPKVYVAVVCVSFGVILATHRTEKTTASTPTATKEIKLSRAVQILMPNDLCDNMQSTLEYWVRQVPSTPYANRPALLDTVIDLREQMRATGCG